MVADLRTLIDVEQGQISRQIFDDPAIYQQEQDRVFGKCWLYLGHESQLPRPGDYFTNYMGEAPVIVTRGVGGRIHAFLNSCRHRGRRICQTDNGNTLSFRCPYHGWTYDTRGKLVGVPHEDIGYDHQLN